MMVAFQMYWYVSVYF